MLGVFLGLGGSLQESEKRERAWKLLLGESKGLRITAVSKLCSKRHLPPGIPSTGSLPRPGVTFLTCIPQFRGGNRKGSQERKTSKKEK